ncbi:TonB-dependent receptor [Novosphingobium endophyticum]|uniref:TonB-dependent receptor n=1 Tax=Novosphingobium endophyticum TaxID=1955250 RepID=A0A916TPG1_9SPHN|nr:TonB-dependent receptor [Novosphingobium endophyticum]GGB87248.1 TonB-dependent receptor [Novosphingobium endophyticum]
MFTSSIGLGLRISAISSVAVAALVPGLVLAQESADEQQDDMEIVVTGTLIRGQAPVGSNLIDLGEQRIEETASSSANELLASVPQVTNYFNSVPAADLAIAVNQIQITRPNIRNISPNAAASSGTLILVDGHRIATAGTSQASVDPDVIPLGAIQRVDVVTEGGSAIYGADAVAGVINFVTKRRFDGVEVDGQYGFADDYWQTAVNATVGKDWGSGSAYIAYSFSKSDELFGRDRDFIRRLDYSSMPYVPLGRECELPNLTVNYTIFGFNVLSLAAGAPNFVPGSVNACDTTDDSAIIPEVERHGGLVSLSQDLDDTTSVDIRAFYSRRDTLATSPLTGQARLPATFPVPAGFPPAIPIGGGAFATPTASGAFSFTPALGDDAGRSITKIEEWGVNAEFRKELTSTWELRGLFNYSRSNSEFSLIAPNTTRLNAAGQAGTIDPFNIAGSDPAVIADIVDNERAGQAIDDLTNLRLIAEGSVVSLPGGDVRMAAGVEYMYDAFKLRTGNDIRIGTLSSTPYDTYNRNVYSAFGELLIPIFGPGNAMGGFNALEISLAARYDNYEDFGSTFNPKIGATWKPIDWLSFRGNWGTSFTAPTPLDQLRSAGNTISAFPFVAFTRPGDTTAPGSFTVALAGSQPDLQPQEAETWSVGFDAEPPFIPGLNLKLSYYNVKFEDILSTPTPGVGIFTNFPDNIQTDVGGISPDDLRAFGMLAPGGSAVVEALIQNGNLVYELVDFRTGNFGVLKVDGLDFGVNYRTATGFGGVDFSVAGNYQLNRKSQVSAESPVVDDLEFDTPKLNLRASAGVDVGSLRAQATVNHTAGYDIEPLQTDPVQDHVGSFTTLDLFFKYEVPASGALLRDVAFTLNVKNVLDEEPPVFFGTGPNENGYANGFTFGRMFVIGVSKKF